MIIRKGTYEDIHQAVELGKAYYAEADVKSLNADLSKWETLIKSLIDTGLGIVAVEDGKIVGMMGARFIDLFFTDTLSTHDVLIFVLPEYRGRGIGKELVYAYIDWALRMGVSRQNIYIGIDSGINTESTIEFYKTLGFVTSGVTMRLKEV